MDEEGEMSTWYTLVGLEGFRWRTRVELFTGSSEEEAGREDSEVRVPVHSFESLL